MSFFSKILDLGESKTAWRCLAVFAVAIAFGYYYLLLEVISPVDGSDNLLATGGMVVSFFLGVFTWSMSERDFSDEIVAEALIVAPDDQWEALADELEAAAYAEFYNTSVPQPSGRWEPAPSWLKDLN